MNKQLDSTPGTYALILALPEPCELVIGSLGGVRFDSPFYLYFGSAFGPGGLRARIKHHLSPVRKPHWHIDYLRQSARVVDVWYSTDETRLECIWVRAALTHLDAAQIPRFGSSDCRCQSHLMAAGSRRMLSTFRHRLFANPAVASDTDRSFLTC